MKLKTVISLLFILLVLFLGSGCGPSLTLVKNNFYNYDKLSLELTRLHTSYSDIVNVLPIGKTYEGRSIFAVKIGGNATTSGSKPALMAIFAEHSAEHEVTDIALGIIQYLGQNYGKDIRVTDLLNLNEVWIVPMMNPDGVEYDLSGSVKPFSWHKNRRPTGESTYGVNLNRNWGHKWNAPVPEDLKKDLGNKKSPVYAGEKPFSEKETLALRDFLLAHPNIRIFIDYHSGYAPFMQGGVGFPIPRSENAELPPIHRKRYEEIAQKFAEKISNPNDSRPPFIISKERDIAKLIKGHAPWYIKPFIPKSIPALPPGTSGEWVYGELGIMVFGVEIFRDGGFFKRLPDSKNELVNCQVNGFLFLLENLSNDPFALN